MIQSSVKQSFRSKPKFILCTCSSSCFKGSTTDAEQNLLEGILLRKKGILIIEKVKSSSLKDLRKACYL